AYKWHDLNGDGQWQLGEPGLAGWTIQLLQDGEVQYSAETMGGEEEGQYWVKDIGPGTYEVCEVGETEGWRETYRANNGCHTITLAPGENFVAPPFAAVPLSFGNQALAMIDAYKWRDLNGDGQWQLGEPGLAGWTIQLLQGGVVRYSAVTMSGE